ncbi:rCG57660 [Rattus norvegicus]|uniref:RCG57660 n=1 Tax=Rattus norvegicus TaxID=10116 RepID=A6JI41_RAT|nr:rCG57660 [Rattus norvegicus]
MGTGAGSPAAADKGASHCPVEEVLLGPWRLRPLLHPPHAAPACLAHSMESRLF